MNKQTIYDLKPEGKTIYIRVDYNVPHDKEGHIPMTVASWRPCRRCAGFLTMALPSSLRAIWAVQRAK